jgi:Protein of unknown function (DUF3775)
MPDLSLDKAGYIIVKARELGAKVEPDDPDSGSNPSDDRAVDVLEDFADDPTREELVGALQGLNDDESLDLIALVWIGRGSFERDEWDEARSQANEIPQADRARYLIGTPMLGDFLEQGLAAFGLSCAETEAAHL